MPDKDEQNQNISNGQNELEKCQKERDEYLNNWKRERADFLNYKKDELKRLERFVEFANEAVILEVIEILDDLEKARQNFAEQNLGGQSTQDGLAQIINKFMELFKKYDTERIKVEGERFDPLVHEALTAETQTTETQNETGEIQNGKEKTEERIEEVRAGYTMHGRVIRPARVKIIK